MHATQVRPVALDASPAHTLRDASLYLQRHGWWQGHYYGACDSFTPPADVTGAMAMVCYGYANPEPYGDEFTDDETHAAWSQFITADHIFADYIGISEATGPDGEPIDYSLHDWNDEEYQTAAAVIAILRACADDVESTSGAA